jgi:ribosomal protein S30
MTHARLNVNGFRFQAGRKKDLLPEKANRKEKEKKMEHAAENPSQVSRLKLTEATFSSKSW